MSHYKHLSIEERENLYLLKKLGVAFVKLLERWGVPHRQSAGS